MFRRVAIICLSALPLAGLARQAESAEVFAATLAELDLAAMIDPVEPPIDLVSASTVPASVPTSIHRVAVPSFLDGVALGDRAASPGDFAHDSGSPTHQPRSALQRLRWLPVFRN